MGQLYKNNAESTLAVAIASTDVVPMNVQVAVGHGDRFPLIATVGADYFDITLESAAGLVEIFRIKQRTSGSDVLVVDSRAREGTTAQNWTTSPATVVGLRVTAAAVEAVLAHAADTTDAHAASAITNTPAGNLAATTVQAALNELQADVDTRATSAALAADIAAHVAASDPHPGYTTAAELAAGLSGYQPLDAQLTTLAGITAQQATDLAALSTFMGTVLNDADADAARVTLVAAKSGAVTGTGITQTTGKILGRTTASTGAIEEITVGTGLTLSAGSLSASATTALSEEYVSSAQTITLAGLLTLAHGLGGKPKIITARLSCTTDDAGYSIGDTVEINPSYQNQNNGGGQAMYTDATNINVRFSNAGYQGHNKATGAPANLTTASWKLIVSAWR